MSLVVIKYYVNPFPLLFTKKKLNAAYDDPPPPLPKWINQTYYLDQFMHACTYIYIVAKYEITKFTSNRGQCAYYTTKRPPTKTQSLPQWHFYGFALCRQVDGLSAGDWQLGVVRRLFPSHAADSCWRFCSPHKRVAITQEP